MKKMYIAICDDEADILGIVKGAIENTFRKYDIEAETDMFKNAEDLQRRMREREFSLIFLDIEMPGVDGITFAKNLRGSNSHTDIIFISNREDLVFDALRVNPQGFIRKKRFLEDVTAVIDQWMENRQKDERSGIMFETSKGTITVPVDQVFYIEGDGRNQEVYVAGQKEPHVIRSSMKVLEEQLQPMGFLRVHKGYLVNYRFIKRIKDTDVILTNGTAIPISRLRVADIRKQYMTLMQNDGGVIL